MESGKFFYARDVNAIVLDCYRLATRYGRDPDEFLAKPLSVIQRHMKYTALLIELQQQQEDSDGA